ncbi:unnamed protein product [Gongylonema pulchrum]|uniref:Uncharacterized protein n=1 Tax=Gongylonema pulchrum TaxID=637853 RepID=A0A3P6R2U9_9BILA|nr:unnamed protein product [Gongylonema pulchrum]
MFGELAEWVPAHTLKPELLNDLLSLICACLEIPQYSIYEAVCLAATCLWRLASRKNVKNGENRVLFALFGDVPMRSILSVAKIIAYEKGPDIHHIDIVAE